MYDFYQEPRHLNKKKVAIVSAIFVLILLLIIFLIARKISAPAKKEPEKQEVNPTTTVFESPDHSVSVELSNALNLKNYESNLGYLMELRSENNLNIFITKETAIPNQALSEILEADKNTFLSNFESHSNLSETKELSVNGNLAYTYSFHYLDKTLNKAFYLQVTWLQIQDTLYIFDIEFPLDDLSFNTNISSAVLSSFKLI